MADIKKFLNQEGVSVLWSKVAEKVAAEEARAKAAEAAALKAAQDAQADIDALEAYVGTIPSDEAYADITNIVAFIQKRAQEVLAQAQGGSSETAASVKAALDAYIALNDPKVEQNAEDIATIMGDYLKNADKEELAGNIATNAGEIARIDAALKLAVENDGAGLDSIKELATWIEEHGTEAAGYAAAIDALELLVGDTAVATQIANAIAAENLAQYAKTADIEDTLAKIDTQGTVTDAINAAISSLAIGDYAKAADLTALAARVTTLENAGYQNNAQVVASIEAAIAALKLSETYDAKGAAATAETNAKAYADGLANNYDPKGAAATAEANAAAALAAAKTELTNAINDAKTFASNQDAVVLAEAQKAATAAETNANAHSDANLATAKSYTDEAYNAIQALTKAEIEAAIASVSTQS